jgi:pimeloyl-ACP methyl ester carboxylesterase
LVFSIAAAVNAQSPTSWTDPSPHKTSFVTVDKDVRLEVLDWGGRGRPLVLLAGAGNTAHVFDDFALQLTGQYHVYGITRRGFGASVYSGSDFGPDRLGDDVLAVVDALKLNKPILVGHSLGGEELSSVASRYPNRIAAVVYLDAAYGYAFDNGKGTAMSELKGSPPRPPAPGPEDLASFAAYAKWSARINGFSIPEAELRQLWETTPEGGMGKRRPPPAGFRAASLMKKYTTIPLPALVIFAEPHDPGAWLKSSTDPAAQEAAKAFAAIESGLVEKQARAIEEAVPTAHVIRIANANHFVYLSNQPEVLREMRAFIGGLSK